LDGAGYFVVYQCGDGRRQAVNVHRLIAEAFCAHPNGKDFVNHLDGDRSNNRSSNLEWCTREENMAHAADTELMKTRKQVTAVSKDGAVTLFFKSIAEAAITMGGPLRSRNISSALHKSIPSAYGFIWKFHMA
jgi:hypothetical protein